MHEPASDIRFPTGDGEANMGTQRLTRILLVEDEPDIQTVARLALEAVGNFQVLTAASGEEAVSRGPDFAPDLILLDVMMPGMDGPSTLVAMREIPQLKEVPVVFMTAKVQAHEVVEYKRLGALDVISKPFEPMALPAKIRDIWREKNG